MIAQTSFAALHTLIILCPDIACCLMSFMQSRHISKQCPAL